MRIVPGCFLALTLLQTISAQGPPGELGVVLSLATKYVDKYESEQLGNLLVTEDYLQSSAEYDPVRSAAGRGLFVASRDRRRLESDFLILQVGKARVGVRMVNKVDGVRVKSTAGSLDALEKGSPEENSRMIASINDENVRYDIGSVLRHTNVPTFALQVVRATEVGRFDFTRNGTEKINGIVTWKIKFAEKSAPTLVHAAEPPKPLFSTGILWIEPTTGRILKTEFSVENPYSKPKATGRMVVEYVEDKNLGIYVPKEMVERYESDRGYVDCHAFYSNFRSFGVKVTSEIAKPQ